MQIKVTNTRMHKVVVYHPTTKDITVPVADAMLVLIPTLLSKTIYEVCVNGDFFKPILISLTEKIEIGDWAYDKEVGKILQVTTSEMTKYVNLDTFKYRFFKILALPEHFSPQILQDIVDGKLEGGNKGGDKVVVECRNYEVDDDDCTYSNENEGTHSYIKLNSSNHITLYKVEEKMYTREEVREICISYLKNYEDDDFNKWFEQNVE